MSTNLYESDSIIITALAGPEGVGAVVQVNVRDYRTGKMVSAQVMKHQFVALLDALYMKATAIG